MKFNGNNRNNYDDNNLPNEDYIENEYDEDDGYYSQEEIEREQRYMEQQESRRQFVNKAKNPFGIRDKIDNLDEQLRYGSSKTKLIFVLGSLAVLAILALVFFMVMN